MSGICCFFKSIIGLTRLVNLRFPNFVNLYHFVVWFRDIFSSLSVCRRLLIDCLRALVGMCLKTTVFIGLSTVKYLLVICANHFTSFILWSITGLHTVNHFLNCWFVSVRWTSIFSWNIRLEEQVKCFCLIFLPFGFGLVLFFISDVIFFSDVLCPCVWCRFLCLIRLCQIVHCLENFPRSRQAASF